MPGLSLTVHAAIAEIPAAEWDALVAHEPEVASPFVRHAFLAAAEESGSASRRTGWAPLHLALRRGGTLVAAAPAGPDPQVESSNMEPPWPAADTPGSLAGGPGRTRTCNQTVMSGRL